jgi:sulfide:quinone oxidoreductase
MVQRSGNGGSTRVLIAGGGVAALEAALALREHAGDRVTVEIHAPRREFLYRPFAVGEPYGAASILRYDLQRLTERTGASFHLGGIIAVDSDERRVTTRDGLEIPYDYLLVAPGARMLWAVPGAVTFWGVSDEGGVGDVVRKLRSGGLRNVVFTMPSGCTWALPVYELALLAAAVLARSGVEDGQLAIVTPEDAPLQIFGRRVGEEMAELLEERGIRVISGTHPVKFEHGMLQVAPGDPIATDAVVTLPRLEGRRIGGIPHDPDGFIAVDDHCAVPGMERVFAAGDVTTFPVKQGGIAAQEADAAAEAIVAALGCTSDPAPFEPILRGVLWTGAEPRYLRGHLTGGHGETSTLSGTPPWSEDEGKIVGWHLTPFLADVLEDGDRSLATLPT